jgi:hypothetical protein
MKDHFSENSDLKQEITNPAMIGQVVKSLFPQLPIAMIYEGEEIPVKVVSATKEMLVIRSLGRKDAEERILTFTNNGSLYHFHFTYLPQSNPDWEFLTPSKMVIQKNSLRKKERLHVKQDSGNSYYINGFIESNSVIEKINSMRGVQKAIEEALTTIRLRFSSGEFHDFSENDFRCKVLQISGLPIFLINSRNHIPNDNFTNLNMIKKAIPESEWETIRGPEITVPIYFRGKIMVGYLKMTHSMELEYEDFSLLNMLQSLITKEINQRDIFLFSDEKAKIIDMSKGGVGFIHPRAGYEDAFKIGKKILFEMHMDKGLFAVFHVIVRNIRIHEEQFLRVGCEFFDLTEEESIFLQNFSEKF